MSYDAVYGLGHPVKSLAVANKFVEIMNKGSYHMGLTLKVFAFGCDAKQAEYGVIDLSEFNGFVDASKTIYDEVAEYRRSVYQRILGTLPDTEWVNASLFFDYLLSISACYIEYPKLVKKGVTVEKKIEKGIYTKNPAIMASWVGGSVAEMNAKYGTRLTVNAGELMNFSVRAVKLTSSRNGNAISLMREPMNCAGFKVMPLFMQYAYMSGIWKQMEQGIVKFTYLKDNSNVRELPTTVNFDILLDYYNDAEFIEHMLMGIDVFTDNQGGMLLGTKQNRGYVKVPELGCSKYDKSGVRALNISRLLKVEKIDEVDRSFINVDLDSVQRQFEERVDTLVSQNPEMLEPLYLAFKAGDDTVDELEMWMTPVILGEKLKEYVSLNIKILTTTYKRILHTFMISNPQWFSNYTGMPVEYGTAEVDSTPNYGVATMDF